MGERPYLLKLGGLRMKWGSGLGWAMIQAHGGALSDRSRAKVDS